MWVDSFEKVMENKSLAKLHNLCEMNTPPGQDYTEYIIQIIRTCSCWIQVGYYYGAATNLLEMVFPAICIHAQVSYLKKLEFANYRH